MSEPEQQATIDAPRAIRVRTSTGWADLAIQGRQGDTGSQGPKGDTGAASTVPGPGVPAGGVAPQILTKTGPADYATAWQNPAAQGADLVYNGDFPANTPYTDGDIVISGGIAYLCVAPTNAAPVPWPGGPTIAPNPMPSYGTSLPASPINGQEAILVDSLTNPTYQWRFRYNANSTSAYKWECIGGSAVVARVETGESVTSTTPSDLATVGPQVLAPRAGEYNVRFGANLQSNAAGQWPAMAVYVGGTSSGIALVVTTLGNGYALPAAAELKATVSSPGTMIKGMYYALFAGQVCTANSRFIAVTPIRVA